MEELAYFDPLLFKFPKGTISKGKEVEFKLKINLDCAANEAYLMLKDDDAEDYQYISMQRIDNFFYAKLTFEKSGHFWYNFKLNYNDFAKFLSKTYDNFSVVLDEKGEDFLQLVTEEEYVCTNSMQGGIIYQIFPDRFCKVGDVPVRKPLVYRSDWGGAIKKNTNDPIKINQEIFGGNFEGVISKLDYLKSLGVTVIYFNPISMANSNHRYDTADYMTIDPVLGTEQTFKKLIDQANERGIKIIIDGVYNHTGSDSIYFNREKNFAGAGAFGSKNSKYFSWFDFEEWPQKYNSWWGIDTLPHIKGNSEDFHEFIAGTGGVLEKYLKLGVFGVRLDVVDELTDEFTKKISNTVKSFNPNAAIIGEVWEDAATKISYSTRRKYFVQNELNSVMNYPVKETIIKYIKTKDPSDLVSTLRMLENNYPKVVRDNLMNFLSTHDTRRIFSEIKAAADNNHALAVKLYKVATAILFTLPGVPSIFYGDEYGMENNDGSSRGCFDWSKTHGEIFNWMCSLSKIRRLQVFKDGELNILCHQGGKFIFERYSKTEHVVVFTNLKSDELDVDLQGNYISLLSGSKISNFTLHENEIQIIYEKK